MSLTDSINALAAQVGQYGVIPDGGIINGKPFGILDWARAGQERVEAAVEALRKARATERCRTSRYGSQPACTLVNGEDFDEIFVSGRADARDVNHRVQASALLDGFSVDEVTAAEEVLG